MTTAQHVKISSKSLRYTEEYCKSVGLPYSAAQLHIPRIPQQKCSNN